MADTEQSNKSGNPGSDVGKQGRAGDTMKSDSKPTRKFSGQIFGPGISDKATKDRAISTAGYALQKELHPTPNHVWMAFFTGASCTKTTNPTGAYSAVFNQDKKLAKMAWYMSSFSDVVNEKRLASLAIAQALYMADKRLRAFADDEERPKKATVKVFTHCVETLKNIDNPREIVGDGREAKLEVVKLIEDLSYSLCNIVGARVRLYLQWVPADYGKMVCARDFAKCCRRKSGRKNMYFVGNEKRDDGLIPEGVSGFIERDTAEEDRHDLMEQPGKAVAIAETLTASTKKEGQSGVHQVAILGDQEMDERSAMVSEQATNDEQASINQQILADCYQQQGYSLRQRGNQDVTN
ncbi:hypothetical protein GE21DRAFT_9508 [Neurospora crassa]|uniref:Uncharacterized protein n=2 Tax=Neurospora crassa TaxID=5141 RepID=Q1K5N6_NEUCR|nr:hypothetical protein NCU05097 [Neurospora crassa OR74A]EAA27847.1 hypothetical protein NCU05097 [Neurospora crassa OR74A]KHE87968.1 hypothetical protein GE21DRAFT_9508 [Neurospora crassa]CAD70423.1 putative protein [Neurospora crassa]|eukprot:XP_957083.1 hypothetical protein NCU05097 [Neurospora crassa OR74A]